jgi:hypothetical protein
MYNTLEWVIVPPLSDKGRIAGIGGAHFSNDSPVILALQYYILCSMAHMSLIA